MSPTRRPTRLAPADADSDRRGGGCVCAPAASSPCRPRRSMAWPATPTSDARGRRDLRRQGAAGVQSADRPCCRCGEARRARGVRRFGAALAAGVLAGAADPRRAGRRQPAGSACSRAPGSTASPCGCPRHPVARALIAAAGVPLVAPSANRSGRVSPTTAAHVAGRPRRAHRSDPRRRADPARPRIDDRRLPRRRAAPAAPRRALRGERDRGGARPARWLAPEPRRATRRSRRACSPRIMRRAPRLRLRGARGGALSRRRSISRGALADQRRRRAARSVAARRSRRSRRQSLRLSARARRRRARRVIAVAPIPERGLGVAINDRLRRAAAPRPRRRADAADLLSCIVDLRRSHSLGHPQPAA